MGLACSLQGWENQFLYFSENEKSEEYQVCCFDNRGAGLSDTVLGRYTTSILAQDAAELLDHLKWVKDIHLVGISMGGMISLELALLKPTVFSSLCLTSTHSGTINHPISYRYPVFFSRQLKMLNPSHPFISAVHMLFPEKFLAREAPKEFQPVHIPFKDNYTMEDVVIDGIRRKDRKTRLTTAAGFIGQISAVMTHYVSPARLRMIKENPNVLMVEKLGGRLDLYHDHGHALPEENPKRYNKMLEEFINESILKKEALITLSKKMEDILIKECKDNDNGFIQLNDKRVVHSKRDSKFEV
ncbi:hypothetical protein HK099_004288 [Clydaea vesicula]|uniref:AB hydrolase-1 domain-containing protein n=1 Tax=Clydaea vesicula TaxID=447962 RepID=A0AAD5UBR9_9FUNG|nr:hypothetical protein HK099_004288 [Clydaea vesicula]